MKSWTEICVVILCPPGQGLSEKIVEFTGKQVGSESRELISVTLAGLTCFLSALRGNLD